MKFETHYIHDLKIAEVISENIAINNSEDGLNLLGNIYYQGFNKVIVREVNTTPDFFDLKNWIAGEIFQKFSNYRVCLAIVRDFSKYKSKSVNNFIYESYISRQIKFVKSLSEAINVLSDK